MAEFVFVVKCFVASLLLVMLMQTPLKNITVEEHFESWLIESRVGNVLVDTAGAAATLTRKGIAAAQGYWNKPKVETQGQQLSSPETE